MYMRNEQCVNSAVNVIEDDDRYPRDRDRYKEVSHTKFQAARFEAVSRKFRGAGEEIGSFNQGFKWEGLSIGPTAPFATPSYTLSWDSIVQDLGYQVRNLLNTKSQLLVTIAEAVKTYQMIRNPFGLLRKNWLKTAGNMTMSQLSKRGANLWLEGRYGWRPLYGDLKNFASSAAKLVTYVDRHKSGEDNQFLAARRITEVGTPSPSSLTASEMDEKVSYYATHHVDEWQGGPSSFPRASQVMQVCSCRRLREAFPQVTDCCGLWEKAKGYTKLYANALHMATPEDLFQTLWELVPYSFVVDWFVNVKGLIRPPRDEIFRSVGITRIGYSVKEETKYKVALCLCNVMTSLPGGGARTVEFAEDPIAWSDVDGTCSVYTRTEGLPDRDGFLNFGGLDVFQATDLLAMLRQRVRA